MVRLTLTSGFFHAQYLVQNLEHWALPRPMLREALIVEYLGSGGYRLHGCIGAFQDISIEHHSWSQGNLYIVHYISLST